MSVSELSAKLGLSEPEVYDLESYEEEVEEVIAMRELDRICEVLESSVEWIITGIEPAVRHNPPVDVALISASLQEKFRQPGITLRTFLDEIGWDLRAVVDNPSAIWGLPFEALQDTCNYLGFDWREFVAPTSYSVGIRYAFIVDKDASG